MKVALLQVIRIKVVAKTTEVAPMAGKIAQTIVMVGPIIVMSLNNVRRRNQEVFDTHSGSSDGTGSYWNTFVCAPGYE